ncbi:hypothetical protein hmeg3_24085 [Herbaspirillum sp. meg3]|uniref:DUF2917 domain-containing protein n=1 Tax=Herbaspirillum sp. meg3 TaxID=2025949 RepID=UPI000B996AE7|nr:DUF2917 domain-containing protein [Herbaspirillum sp. meg3]ASU41076.1 hypothetical protein hmeg3_24085 [Herbaspirillum sp. meg3]
MQNIFTRRQIRLQAGDVTSLQVTRPICLQVGSGRVWITIEGARTDYWLSGGQSLDIPGQGLVVIESVDTASKLHVGLCRRHWLVRLTNVLNALAGRFSSRNRAGGTAAKIPEVPGSCSQ